MNEAQTESTSENVNVLGMAADAPSSEDKALQAIWDKNNGPEAILKNPEMPPVPKGEDEGKAAWEWIHMPKKDRIESAAVYREFADLKKQAEALGMKTESAADIKAVQDMLAGKDQKPATIDRDTQASLDTFKAVVPFAKDHKEASSFLNGWVEAIARDPDKGWSELLKAQGMGHLLRDATDAYAAVQADTAVAPYLETWAKSSGATKADMAAMADIMSAPSWREIAGESDKSALDRAYKAMKRQSKHGRMNAQMDAELRATAADIYRD
jgi:hypothetical protein